MPDDVNAGAAGAAPPPGSDLDGLVERTLSGETVAGVEVAAYRWRSPLDDGVPGGWTYSYASHWSTGPADAERLVPASTLLSERALRERVEGERDEHQQSFDLRWNADMRAIKRWREAHPGNDLVLPDHADLVVWLLEQLAELRSYEEAVNSVAAANAFDGAAEKWLSLNSVDRMVKAITSVFAKWSNDEIMGRFRQKIADTMHLAFVEGALVGKQGAAARLSQLEAELKRRDEALRDVKDAHGVLLEAAYEAVAELGETDGTAERFLIPAILKADADPDYARSQFPDRTALQPQEGGK